MKYLLVFVLVLCALTLAGFASPGEREQEPRKPERDGACLRCVPW